MGGGSVVGGSVGASVGAGTEHTRDNKTMSSITMAVTSGAIIRLIC